MSLVSDYPDSSPHYATAEQIAGTGAPLLVKTTQLVAGTGTTIAPGATHPYPAVAVNQPGYHGSFQPVFSSAPVIPFVQVTLTWSDPTTGFVVATENYVIPGGLIAVPPITLASGLAKGAQLTVSVTNLDSSVGVTVNAVLNQDSIPRSRDYWHWLTSTFAGATIGSFNLPQLPVDETVGGILSGVTVAASTTRTWLFGMLPGTCNVGWTINSGDPTNTQLRITAVPASLYGTNNIIYQATSSPANFEVALPRAPISVMIQNLATAPVVASMAIIFSG